MPLVSRTFDQLIDFTRTSAGTYVDETGKIVSTPASRNLLTFTQEFDNAAWTKSNATVTADSVTSPDGTADADSLVEDTATAAHSVYRSTGTLTGAYAATCYVKPAGRSWCYMEPLGNAATRTYFNLSGNGSVGTTGSGVTASITAVGNGWYRITTIYTYAAAAAFFVIGAATADATASYTGNGAVALYLWGAQLETGTTATTYTRNYGGLYPPRFDYDPVTLAPKGLLIEEQRTNLLTYSEQFDNAAWTKNDCAVTANSTTSPDGTVTADTVTANAGTAFHYVRRASALTPTGAHTYTFYVKKNTASWVFFTVNDSGINYFNLDTGLFGTTPDTCSASVAGNGWYRISVTRTLSATAANCGIGVANGDGGASFNAAGTESVYIWGAQLEAGSFATSYIPTVASQVTRTADVAEIGAPNFASWFNQSSGTFVAEFQTVALRAGGTTGHRVIAAYDGTASNVSYLYTYAAIAGGQIVTGGVLQADLNGGGSPANNTTIKSAMAYATNDVAATVNGATPATDTSATMPTVNRLGLGSQGASQLNGWLRSVRYYPSRLTNAQLQALTA